jgi:hypothetical protein
MIGGHDGSTYLNSVERYDPNCDQWSCQVAAAGCSRTSVGVAVLGDCIYAVGGQDGSACLSLVERYVAIQAFCRVMANSYTKVQPKHQQVAASVLHDKS